MSNALACAYPDLIAAAAPCNGYNEGYFSSFDAMMRRWRQMTGNRPLEETGEEEAKGPTPLKIMADVKKAAFDYRMPVFLVSGLLDGKWPIEDPGDSRLNTFNYWKEYNNIPVESHVFIDSSESGLKADETFYDGDDRRFLHHRWLSRDEGNPSLYELFLAKRMPHAVDLRTFEYTWEFMKKFSRNPDGTLNIN